jgi:choline dehydrogenase-like flavoprotein
MAGAGVASASAFTPLSVARAEVWEEGDEQRRVQQVQPNSPPELDERQLKRFISVSETLIGTGKGPAQSPLVLKPRLAAQYSGHIMGTTWMGLKRENSVVNKECHCHGHPNLFVLGSSVFPTGSTANPTIAALSLRAVPAIMQQLNKPRT